MSDEYNENVPCDRCATTAGTFRLMIDEGRLLCKPCGDAFLEEEDLPPARWPSE